MRSMCEHAALQRAVVNTCDITKHQLTLSQGDTALLRLLQVKVVLVEKSGCLCPGCTFHYRLPVLLCSKIKAMPTSPLLERYRCAAPPLSSSCT